MHGNSSFNAFLTRLKQVYDLPSGWSVTNV
jgi:hypothetical protein